MIAKYLALTLAIAPVVFAQQPSRRDEAPSQQPQIQTMQQAIAFERHKEEAAARQAQIEARKATRNSANRGTEQPKRSGAPERDK